MIVKYFDYHENTKENKNYKEKGKLKIIQWNINELKKETF